MKIFFLCLLFCLNALAIQTPPESLFRQASSQEITGNTVSVNYLIRKNSAEGEQLFYLRVIAGVEQEKFRMSQFLFSSADMGNDKLIHAFSTSNIEGHSGKDSAKDSFANVVYYLYLLQNKKFFSYLKSLEPELKSNSELVNKEKVKLLEGYKAHLQKNSDTNPLRPTTLEEKKKVNELMESSLYQAEPQHYEMVLNHKTVEIKLTYPHFTAYFNNQDHRLQHLDLILKDNISYHFEEHVNLNGVNLLPKFINLKINDDSYRIQTLSVKNVTESFVDFDKRATATDALAKKNNSGKTHPLPQFIY
jgi:hypothetical protein